MLFMTIHVPMARCKRWPVEIAHVTRHDGNVWDDPGLRLIAEQSFSSQRFEVMQQREERLVEYYRYPSPFATLPFDALPA
jgi:hypothetical protein